MHKLNKFIILTLVCLFLGACHTNGTIDVMRTESGLTTKQASELQQGKREFSQGMYKRARMWLLPLAVDGNAEAQYGIGYMYYYGYGVQQDTDTGLFWISRSADQHYPPAIQALGVIHKQGSPN